MHVLIVDDDEDFANTAATVLRAEGHEVQIELDTEEGRQSMENRCPDLVILDVMFPEDASAGFDLARVIRHEEGKLKDVRTQIDEIYGKIRKYEAERRGSEEQERRDQQKEDEKERVDAAIEKMQSGKRLTFDEFILAQRSVADDKKTKKRRFKKASEDVVKVVTDDSSTAEPEVVEAEEDTEAIAEDSSEE